MVYAVFSDVHANASALRAVLADARRQGAERFVCLGDVVGYGPEPVESVRLLREIPASVIAGNHDDAVSGRGGADDFVGLAADAVHRHRAALPEGDIKWLSTLPYTCTVGSAMAAHGDLRYPAKFYYIEDIMDAAENFAATEAQLVFVGHTHVPQMFLTGSSGRIYKIAPQDFALESGKRYIVNVGSVGYPRETNGECYSSYVIYDSTNGTVTFRRLPFSVASVMQRGDGEGEKEGNVAVSVESAGAPPRHRSLWPIFALIACAGIVMLLFLLLGGRGNVAMVPEKIREVEVSLSPRQTKLKANLRLDADSSPVRLDVRFIDAAGNEMSRGAYDKEVKVSSTKALAIPKGAVRARVTLRAESAETAKVISLYPKAE